MRNSTPMSSDSSKSSSISPGPNRRVRTNLFDSCYSTGTNEGAIFSDGRSSFPNRKKHPNHEPTGTSQVLTFYPTMAEFRDFPGYIKKIEATGAHSMSGICKIVPPEGWSPRPSKEKDYSDVDNYLIDSPVKESISGKNGVYLKTNAVYKKKMSVAEFRHLANSATYKNPSSSLQGLDIESQFFSTITEREPIYGADTEGSIYELQVNEFNMNRLGTILDETRVGGQVIKGVNTVYLYFGMYKTCFPWHAEDMDLYSINYLHFGAPKYWFAISAESADRFEKIMDQYFPERKKECDSFLRHKSCIVTPDILRMHGIPYSTMIQRQNEFIITFPKGYHMGFNLGYNCAESTNFASDRWIDFGKNVTHCKCRKDCVQIDMRPYMKKYRPKEFNRWHTYWYEEAVIVQPKKSSSGRPPKKKKRASLDYQPVEFTPPNWKETQSELWARSRVDLFAEKMENENNALQYPHCAVCQIFNSTRSSEEKEPEIPKYSDRIVSSRPFAKNNFTPAQEAPTTDLLATCANCRVTVHPSCYGGEPVHADWKCFRCRNPSDVAVRASFCNLCEMRAGALLPYKNGSDFGFAHVTCAIFNRRTAFDRIIGPTMCFGFPAPRLGPSKSVKSVINGQYAAAMSDEHESSRFQCDVCKEIKEGLVVCSACPDDSVSATLAHATCGMKAGFLFEERDFPLCTAMVCSRHNFKDEGNDDGMLGPLAVGDEVIVWLDGGDKVAKGKITNTSICRYMVVEFVDGSLSRNTPPEDVIACSCRNCDKVTHEKGARLKVKWTDELNYDCYYRYTQSEVYEHSVLLGSGEQVTALRSEIYGPNDPRPPDIRRKMEKVMP